MAGEPLLPDSKGEKIVPARCAREFQVTGKDSMARVVEKNRRNKADLIVLPRPAESLQSGTGAMTKDLYLR